MEKPLVFDLDEGRELIDAAAADGLFFAINFNHRYAEPVLRCRADLAAGRFGRLSLLTWRFGGEGSSAHDPHANLIETQCHGLDLLEHLGGPIVAVSATMTTDGPPDRPEHRTLVVALTFASGAVGSLVGSYASSYAYPGTHQVEVDGHDGRALIENTVQRYTFSTAADPLREVWEAGYFDDRGRSFRADLRHPPGRPAARAHRRRTTTGAGRCGSTCPRARPRHSSPSRPAVGSTSSP